MKIPFNVEYNIDTDEIKKQVVDGLVRALVMEYGTSSDDEFSDVRTRLFKEAEERLSDSIQKEVDDHLDAFIYKELDKPRQRTDTFGKPVGDPETIAQRIERAAIKYLDRNVNEDGREVASSHYGKTSTRVEWLVMKTVAGALDRDVTKRIDEACRQAKAQFMEKITQITSETMRRLLGL